MADLLVASVFAGRGHNNFWLKLQRDALQRSLGDFDHAVFLNDADVDAFNECTVVGHNPTPRPGGKGHLDGLKELSAYCRAKPHRHYLILDSDCFPANEHWLTIINAALDRHGKRFAAPARVENLDTFPHPCALFTSDVAYVDFATRPSTNLLGAQVNDVGCDGPREAWLPLLKSNRVSVHPTLATIYSDLFYHHGAGSRKYAMRATTTGYYDHVLPDYPAPDHIFDELERDAAGFVARLR